MFKRIIDIFRIHREERLPASIAFLYFALLNALNVYRYWDAFTQISTNYHRLFVVGYKVSGFDPLTYEVVSNWFPAYDVHRHPLLAFFMWPVNQLNQGLMSLTGTNYAILLTAIVLLIAAFYSFLFLWRIVRNVIGLSDSQTAILTTLYFTFGFIALSSMVPDHFVMSQCCLLLVLWLSGEKLRKGSALNMWQTILLFCVTAGISLNNGLKVFLAAMVTRRKRFFEWRFLLFACIIPASLLWATARWEYRTWRLPKEKARAAMKLKRLQEDDERLRNEVQLAMTGTVSHAKNAATIDSIAIDSVFKAKKEERKIAKENSPKAKSRRRKMGEPISKGGFMQWTDKSTSRWDAAVENLFGEAIQLHRDYALKDVLKSRPVVVSYSQPWSVVNYTVEALLLVFFIIGVWCGRRSIFLWTAMSMFLMDMTLHMGLGFGINEIYIMSAHYLFVMPIAIAFLLKASAPRYASIVTLLLALMTFWCAVWNGIIIINNFQ